MAPGKDKQLQLVDNIRVADVKIGLQSFAVDPSVEILLHVFLSCHHSRFSELHSQLSGTVVQIKRE